MPLNLPLFGWKRPDPPPQAPDDTTLGDAVEAMLQAKMDILRATLKAREAFLRAMASQTDSKAVKADCSSRADEVAFILGSLGK